MRRYLLDTTPLTAYLKGVPSARELIAPWITRQEAATSILVYGEVTEYNKSFLDVTRRQQQLRQLLREVSPYVPPSRSSNATPSCGASCARHTDPA